MLQIVGSMLLSAFMNGQFMYSEPEMWFEAKPEKTVTKLHAPGQGMRSYVELSQSVQDSLQYLRAKGKKSPLHRDLVFSLEKLQRLLPLLDRDPRILLKEFDWVKLFTDDEPFLFTGYHHPLLRASRVPRDGYVPIYRMPKGKKRFDRRAILNGALRGKGLELAWVRDPFEVFLLEVQGSGCLAYDDGTYECVRYAGQNGFPYKSSRKILEEHGLLYASDIFEQKEFFARYPEKLVLLEENPSFVFFARTSETRAMGAMNKPLYGWRSVAVDPKVVPLGGIVVLETLFPDDTPFRGLMLAQDTGGAIKKGRIDIFCGATRYAAYIAAKLDASGPAWLLLAKDRPSLSEKKNASRTKASPSRPSF